MGLSIETNTKTKRETEAVLVPQTTYILNTTFFEDRGHGAREVDFKSQVLFTTYATMHIEKETQETTNTETKTNKRGKKYGIPVEKPIQISAPTWDEIKLPEIGQDIRQQGKYANASAIKNDPRANNIKEAVARSEDKRSEMEIELPEAQAIEINYEQADAGADLSKYAMPTAIFVGAAIEIAPEPAQIPQQNFNDTFEILLADRLSKDPLFQKLSDSILEDAAQAKEQNARLSDSMQAMYEMIIENSPSMANLIIDSNPAVALEMANESAPDLIEVALDDGYGGLMSGHGTKPEETPTAIAA